MPKLVLTMNDFSGGQNTTTAPRDLSVNELTLCENVDPTNKGQLHMGRSLSITAVPDYAATAPQTGQGLVIWTNDYGLDASSTAGFVGQFIGKSNDTKLDVLQTTDGATGTVYTGTTLGLTSLPTSQAYYVAEGDIYIGGHSAGTFVAPKSLTMHRREDFPGTDLARSVQDWKTLTQKKTAPANATGNKMLVHWGYYAAGDQALAGNTMASEDLTWSVIIGEAESGNWENNGDEDANTRFIQFAGSWLYKNKAESPLTEIDTATYNAGSSRTLDDGPDMEERALRIQAWFNVAAAHTTDNAARSGARLYAKYSDTSTWYTLAEVDWERGIIGDGESDWTPWDDEDTASPATFNNSAANPEIIAATSWITDPPEAFTFENWNMYKESLIPTDNLCYFKTGCVANMRAYVANVKINSRTYPDRILKSPVFQYDVFTEDLMIDTALNDGDEIVKLVPIGDRLLIFKHSSVMVLNISQVDEQVESEFKGAGLENPGGVVTTPHGVVWANKNGCYLFNGEIFKSLNQRQEAV